VCKVAVKMSDFEADLESRCFGRQFNNVARVYKMFVPFFETIPRRRCVYLGMEAKSTEKSLETSRAGDSSKEKKM